MDTPQNDGKGGPAQYQRVISDNPAIEYWKDPDRGLVTERSRVQVELIVKAFGAAGIPIGVHPGGDGETEYLYRPGVVLTRDQDAQRVHEALGGDGQVVKRYVGDDRTRRGLSIAGLHPVVIPEHRSVPDVLDELDARLGVGVAVPDHVLHVSPAVWCAVMEPIPSGADTRAAGNEQPEADGRDALVVVVDTGSLQQVIDAHSWLEGVTGEEEPATVGHYSGHGTFIAGVVRTWAPKATVHVTGVLSVGGSAFESDVVAGLVEALDLVPDVINLSGGTRSRLNLPLMSFEVFWEQRLSQLKGTVLVACAGNDGDRGPFWPAAFPWAVSVGALDAETAEGYTARAGFSNYGSWVDVYAPGTAVVNAFPTGPYEYREPPREGESADFPDGLAFWSGTSFAAPMVAGLVASRTTVTGESAADAADALIGHARADAVPGVSARLYDDSGTA